MKLKFILAALLLVSLLTACNGEESEQGSLKDGSSNEAKSEDKEAINVKELVEKYSSVKLEGQSASITPKELVIKENDQETIYDVSGEEFFVSIAPYINETHP